MSVLRYFFLLYFIVALFLQGTAQQNQLPELDFSKSLNKVSSFVEKKNHISQKRLKSFDKHQQKFFNKLCKKNPQQADALYLRWALRKQQLNAELTKPLSASKKTSGVYNPFHDSLSTLLSFMKDTLISAEASTISAEFDKATRDQRAIGDYLREQKNFMGKVVKDYPDLAKSFTKLNKDAYYFIQENHYLDKFFKQSKLLKEELFQNLAHHKDFGKYFKDNNALAGMFKTPKDWGKSLQGLQTNASVAQIQQQALKHLNLPDISSFVSDKFKQGETTVKAMKTSLPWLNNAGDLPSFKPNKLKGKPTSERMHYGFDFKFEDQKDYVPHGVSVGGNISYQLIMKGYIGAGVAYRAGFGSHINSQLLNTNGITLRSFVDYQLHGMLYLSGGYEITSTPNQAKPNTEIAPIAVKGSWYGFDGYESLLMGLKIKREFLKKSAMTFSVQLDFLHDQHSPQTPFVIYKLGWEFGSVNALKK